MEAILIYIHLAAIAVVSAMFLNAIENRLLKVLFGFTEVSALLTTYGYAIWSLVKLLI